MASEKRLIDANMLMEQVKAIHKAVNTQSINTSYDTGFHSATSQIQGLIAYMPTVDAVEVVHGRWIFKHNPITDPKKYFIRIVCSECNLHTGQKSNYCPNCGAKMDGGKNSDL